MNLWAPHEYTRLGIESGVSPDTLAHAKEQAHRVQREGLPAILTLRHLADHTSVPYSYLREVVGRKVDPYRTFSIRKRTGGRRQICVAEPMLHQVQRWLSCHVLKTRSPHPSSYAYAPKSSIIRCAQVHAGANWLIKVDVNRFFESISEIQAYRVFNELGYEPLIAFELARLCTRVYSGSARYRHQHWNRFKTWKYEQIPLYNRPMKIGHLPQGAATSPMLSNLAVRAVDADLTALATAAGLAYTRYSDDLIFSAGGGFSRAEARSFVFKVYRRLLREGLWSKRRKTTIAPPGARKVVLGLLVDGPKPRLSREFRSRLSLHLHFLRKFGPAEHASRRGFRSVLSLRRHIEGLLAFAQQVGDPCVTEWLESMDKVNWNLESPIPTS